MKKILHSIVLILFLFSNFITPVHADMGPKPSVTINFKGIDEEYYVTLLSDQVRYGPWSIANEFNLEGAVRKSIWEAFSNYEDEYYFIGNFEECTKTHQFHWGYHPPEKFKVLIYFVESNTFMESEILERYSFNSYFTITIDHHEMIIKNEHNYTKEITSFLGRIIITLLIEFFIAYIFSLASHYKVIVFANILTQIFLNVVLHFSYLLWTYLLLEVFIVFIEAFIYKRYMKDVRTNKIWLYSISANLLSLILGSLLAVSLQFIF